MDRKAVNLQEDENLAVEVKKYPVLYDKSCPYYNEKRSEINASKQSNEEVGFEEGKAEEKFGNLKARYSGRKTAVKKAKSSGAGRTNELVPAETALDPVVSGAESSSILDGTVNITEEENHELKDESEKDFDNGEKKDFDNCIEREEKESERECTQEDVEEKSPEVTFHHFVKPPGPPFKMVRWQDHLREKQKLHLSKVTEDAEDIFGKLVTQKLRSLSVTRKIKLEFEINSAIFKYVTEEREEWDGKILPEIRKLMAKPSSSRS